MMLISSFNIKGYRLEIPFRSDNCRTANVKIDNSAEHYGTVDISALNFAVELQY